ncbi:MAG: dicarboxylate/amino acid:cation symporter, partial [Myxococcales bacterium]|nr:dicarboxylate/amino acid:cation symporter [Myxococcales bacterium]
MKLHNAILLGMAVGSVAGVLVGPSSVLLPPTAVRLIGDVPSYESPSDGAAQVALTEDSSTFAIVERQGPWVEIEDQSRTAWVDGSHPGVVLYSGVGQRLVDATEWIGRLFLALIRMVVVPLVFFSLVVGVASPRRRAPIGATRCPHDGRLFCDDGHLDHDRRRLRERSAPGKS